MALKENYKDDILDVSQNVKRKYQMENNGDGTVSFTDVTEYTQEGDSFGASDLNAMAHAINNVSSDAEHTSYDNTESGLVSDNVQGAIDEINDNLTASNQTAGVTDVPFRFGCTDDGKFGYIINQGGADSVIPFNSIREIVTSVGYDSSSKLENVTVVNLNDNSIKAGLFATTTQYTTEYIKLTKNSSDKWVIQAVKKCHIILKTGTISNNMSAENLVSEQNYEVGEYITNGTLTTYTTTMTMLIEEYRG